MILRGMKTNYSGNNRMSTLLLLITMSSWLLGLVQGHGRLIEPPSRSSMWRYGFKTPRNYNDNELFCGGFTVHVRNGGKCGICGDPWHSSQPRANEAGGKYGNGIIVRNYSPGEVIETVVQLTAAHKGFFEFKLCPNNDPQRTATQECLDQYPLVLDDTGETRYQVGNAGARNFPIRLRLPPGLECSQCVFQWSYTAGNNWGTCEDGSGAVGCGPQETFRGCADVSIGSQGSVPNQEEPETNDIQSSRPIKPRPTKLTTHFVKPSQVTYTHQTSKRKYRPTVVTPTKPHYYYSSYHSRPRPSASSTSYLKPIKPSASTTYIKPIRPSSSTTFSKRVKPSASTSYIKNVKPSASTSFFQYVKPTKASPSKVQDIDGPKCRGVGPWKKIPGIDTWCDQNCSRGYCPPSHCVCA